ncbi:hypothetical protein ACFWZJ_00585 [Streptomyces massasporeus]
MVREVPEIVGDGHDLSGEPPDHPHALQETAQVLLPGCEERPDRDVGEQPGSGSPDGADLHDASQGGEDRPRKGLGSGRGDPFVAALQAGRQSHSPASSCSPVPCPRSTTTS